MSEGDAARNPTPAPPAAAARPTPRPGRPLRRRISIAVAAWLRWLHIYVSMLGLAAVLFFSVTGLTLNHPSWFEEARRTTTFQGSLDRAWLGTPAPDDPDAGVDRLAIVERLRRDHGIGGAMTEFRAEDAECSVNFQGPGYDAHALIDRDSGRYDLTETRHGLVAVLNDLHKGRDSGPVWFWVVDVSAVVLTVISLSGLLLLFYLKLRRQPGLVVGLVGTLLVFALYWFGVP